MNALNNDNIITAISSGTVTKGTAVKVTGQSAGLFTVALCEDPTHLVYGIALETVATGLPVRVAIAGKCEAVAAGAITAGTHRLLSVTTGGALEPYAVGDIPIGLFLGSKKGSATAAASDIIEILIVHGFVDTIV